MSLEASRKRQLNRLKVRAERDNRTVCVNDGVLSVDVCFQLRMVSLNIIMDNVISLSV